MRHVRKRCKHCNTEYYFVASGDLHPEERKLNDERYCPDCQKKINKALSKVTPKFIPKWVDTEEITKEAKRRRNKNKHSFLEFE